MSIENHLLPSTIAIPYRYPSSNQQPHTTEEKKRKKKRCLLEQNEKENCNYALIINELCAFGSLHELHIAAPMTGFLIACGPLKLSEKDMRRPRVTIDTALITFSLLQTKRVLRMSLPDILIFNEWYLGKFRACIGICIY